jgi:hypothetical protein
VHKFQTLRICKGYIGGRSLWITITRDYSDYMWVGAQRELLAVQKSPLCVNLRPCFFFRSHLSSGNMCSGQLAYESVCTTRLRGLCFIESYNYRHKTIFLTRQTYVCKLQPSLLHSIRITNSNSAFHLIQSTNSCLAGCCCLVLRAGHDELYTLRLPSFPVLTHTININTDCYTTLWLSTTSHWI